MIRNLKKEDKKKLAKEKNSCFTQKLKQLNIYIN